MSKLNIPKYIFIITIFYFLLFCIYINPYDISDTGLNFILIGIGYGIVSLIILILHKLLTLKVHNSYFYTNLIFSLITLGVFLYGYTHLLDGMMM